MTGRSEKDPDSHSIRKARAARAEALRRARENPVARETVGVFVTRLSDGNLFGWEIRQFGGIVLERAQKSFATHAEAQADGTRALAGRFPETSDGRAP